MTKYHTRLQTLEEGYFKNPIKSLYEISKRAGQKRCAILRLGPTVLGLEHVANAGLTWRESKPASRQRYYNAGCMIAFSLCLETLYGILATTKIFSTHLILVAFIDDDSPQRNWKHTLIKASLEDFGAGVC